MRRALQNSLQSGLLTDPSIDLSIDEIVIDEALLGPGGHAPALVAELESELRRLLTDPVLLQGLRARGDRALGQLAGGAIQLNNFGGTGSTAISGAALAQALCGAITGSGGAPAPRGSVKESP